MLLLELLRACGREGGEGEQGERGDTKAYCSYLEYLLAHCPSTWMPFSPTHADVAGSTECVW